MNLNLPNWALNRDIFIMSGPELVAFYRNGHWMVKTQRCNVCGKCCMGLPEGTQIPTKDGNCLHLTQENDKWVCGLRQYRPFACGIATPGFFTNNDYVRQIPECVEKFEEQ